MDFITLLTIHLVAPCLVCVVKHLIFVGGDVASCFGPEALAEALAVWGRAIVAVAQLSNLGEVPQAPEITALDSQPHQQITNTK